MICSVYLPDSVAAKMAASAFLTTGSTQGFPSAVRYAPTPRLTYECRKHQEIYASFLIMSWHHSALTLSGWESSWKSLVSLKTSMGGAICTGENSDDLLVGICKVRIADL